METMALFLLIMVHGFAGGQATAAQKGFVGESVLLTCPCSDDSEDLAWQIDDKVVSHYPQDKNDSPIDESYTNRTQLFLNLERKNCSMLLINLSLEDAGVYTCHVLIRVRNAIWSRNSSYVNLTVSEREKSDNKTHRIGDTDLPSLHIGVPILVVVVILAVGLLLTWVFRRRRENRVKKNISYVPTEPCEV